MTSALDHLGLRPGADERSIKRAYAALLKKTRPEDDPVAFQALREAYEEAMAAARQVMAEEQETAAPAAAAFDTSPVLAEAGDNAYAATESLVEPAVPSAQAQREAAWHEAGILWQQFLATSRVSPRLKLEQICGPAAPLSLLGHEAFEVMAARWCASEECDPDLREAVVDHFGWVDDCRHLERLDGDTVHHALARYRGHRAFVSLRANGSVYVTGALFSRTIPRFSLLLLNGAFIREMRNVVQQVRWHAPELLYFHLDRTVFEWWEQRVLKPRVTVQSVLLSMLAGLLLFGASALLIRPSEETIWWQLLGCEVAAILAGLWVRLKSPFIVERLMAFRGQYFDRPLHGEHYKRTRYGWLALFVPASLAMFIPQPGAVLQSLTAIMMMAAAAGAVYGAVPVLRPVGYVIICVFGWFLGGLVHDDIFPAQHVVACVAFAVCVHSLLMTHAMREHDLGLLPGRLRKLRLGWIAGSVALIFTPNLVALPYSAAPLLWLWTLGGAVIGIFSVSALIAFPVYLLLWIMTSASYRAADNVSDHRIFPLESLLLALTIYIVLSMWHSRERNK